MHNLFRGGNITSGTSTLQSVKGKGRGNDDVGNGIGKSGGVPDGGVSDRGAKIYVDGAAALIMAIDALVCGSTIGSGSGGGWEVDVGETEAGSGCSSTGSTSSSGGINSGYTCSGTYGA
ncbi:hypothetical protein Tco_0426638 [Tanacetum coccineum]